MYNPTFGSAALARHLNKSDFLNQPAMKNEAHKAALIIQAVTTARNDFSSLPLTPNNLAGRTIYQVDDLACDLVLRNLQTEVVREI